MLYLYTNGTKCEILPADIGYVLSTPTVPEFLTGREFLKFLRDRGNKLISTDTSITSNKKGFDYLNELFIK